LERVLRRADLPRRQPHPDAARRPLFVRRRLRRAVEPDLRRCRYRDRTGPRLLPLRATPADPRLRRRNQGLMIAHSRVEYRLLGPLEARRGDGPLPLGGVKQRALLALLLLNANRVVARDRLVDELWGERPPETAVATIQVYVSR